jgi:hypothetical protein
MMRLNLTIDPDLDGTSPGKHISERRISRAESEWAKRMAQEFKAGRARKAEEDGKLLEEQRIRKESASKLRTDLREAFKHEAKCLTLRSERKFSPGKSVTLILSVYNERTLRDA